MAQLVARVVWEKPPRQFHNFISGCCAVGSAPALGAGGPGFESPHSDHLSQKNRLFRRFSCVLSSVFWGLMIAVFWWVKGQKSGKSTSEDCHRNLQIPNPSLIGVNSQNCALMIETTFNLRYNKFGQVGVELVLFCLTASQDLQPLL